MSRQRAFIATMSLGLSLGCAPEQTSEPGGPVLTTAAGDTDSGGDPGPDPGGEKWDVQPGTDLDTAGDVEDDGCKKVDLLFVIDDSGSMFDNQVNLIQSFPGFVQAMREELADVKGYHVGVVTSDAYAGNEPGCQEIGALVTQTGDGWGPTSTCGPFAEGMRYMTEHDDLETAFACAGLVGDGGNGDEHQAEAGIRAVSPQMNMPGACNEGFIRDDALLVVVFITDEDDGANCADVANCEDGSAGTPEDWFPVLVGHKGGNEENIVMASLLWGMPGNSCGNAQSSEHVGSELKRFTEMFTYGFVGDVCAPDYSPVLQDAISLIDSACQNFDPPG